MLMNDELLLHSKQRNIGKDYKKFTALAKRYGDKAAGLALLPPAWTPTFIGIPALVHQKWRDTGIVDLDAYVEPIIGWLKDTIAGRRVLFRSSGVGETLRDRGVLRTIELPANCTIDDIKAAAKKVFEHARTACPERQVGAVLQLALTPEAAGHLSNETSVTPTRNQWSYETEIPTWSPPQGLNSKFAPFPDLTEAMRGKRPTPHDAMRSLGQWVNKMVEPRSHIEWVLSDGMLWVVQIDLEWSQKDTGADPLKALDHSEISSPIRTACNIFKVYVVQ
jgi:hypothetical protein